MRIDLRDQGVTDVHCFSFGRTRFTKPYLSRLFMAGGPTVMSVRARSGGRDLESSIPYRRFMLDLGRLLKVQGKEGSVLPARGKAARSFGEYCKMLFRDVRIRGMALDNGLEHVSFEEFLGYAPAKTFRIFRIEPLIKRLLEDSTDFSDLEERFTGEISDAVRKKGFCGFKSVIAYRTGLDIGPPSLEEARRSFKEKRREVAWFGPRVKPVRDYLLYRTAELASKRGLFLQIHAGLGDTDILADRCNPLLLQGFLRQDSVLKTPIVLIHGGYPYTAEAAWLCSMFPNLYFELSTPFPPTFLPALSKSRFDEVLEVVPGARVVYGSDAIETPELHWYSAKLAKEALAASLQGLVEKEVVSEDEAYRLAAMVLDGNARRLLT